MVGGEGITNRLLQDTKQMVRDEQDYSAIHQDKLQKEQGGACELICTRTGRDTTEVLQ